MCNRKSRWNFLLYKKSPAGQDSTAAEKQMALEMPPLQAENPTNRILYTDKGTGNGDAMNRTRFKLNQNRAPIHEVLENFRRMRVVPFDVPGHKRGRGNPELTEFLGQKCVGVDVNSMKPLDNLCHPVSVIREAEELAADAFGAAHAFLMVGGTTSSVQTMVLTACKRGDEIILPRNVHRSVLNALVLCGAIPVYVNPEVDQRLGISLGMRREQVAKAIKEHPNAVSGR